ncbi:MAG: YceI family protein, partial [Planctomycetota bacterium]
MSLLPLILPLLAGEIRLGFDRYEADPASSSIGFDGSSSLHDFTAKAGRFGGEARLDPSSLSALAGGTVWIETGSLDSGSKGRDEDMKELLESTRYSRITFALDRAEGRLEAWRGDLALHGRFTVRGVEKERVVAARIEPREGGFRAVGEVRFKMSEHGIKPPRILLIKTADEVRVWFDLAFRRVRAEDLPATVRGVEVRERTETADGGGEESVRQTRLWSRDGRLLWEREGTWIVGSSQAVVGLLPAQAARLSLPAPAEESFRPLRDRAEALRE